MTSLPPCSLLLVDIDGTLVDSNDAHAMAWVEALDAHGHKLPFERVRRCIGMGGDQLLPHLLGLDDDSPQGEAIQHLRGQIFRSTYLPSVRPFPGVRAFVQRMLDAGLSVRTATSASEAEVRPLLQIACVDDLLLPGASAADVEASKPAPDVLHVALARDRSRPRDAVLVGDTPYDLEAARRAGVRSVAVRCGGGWTDHDLALAEVLCDRVEQLLPPSGG